MTAKASFVFCSSSRHKPGSSAFASATLRPFSARLGGERATFVSAKVAKTIAPGMPVSATSCCRNFPALLAPSGPARTRTSLCSDMRALPSLGAAMLGVMQRRGFRFAVRPSMASLEARPNGSPRHCSAHDVRQWGPSDAASARRKGPKDGPHGCGAVRRGSMDGPSANPGVCEQPRSAWMREGRVRGVAFSLVTFSWPRKRKSHARPGGERKKAWMPDLNTRDAA